MIAGNSFGNKTKFKIAVFEVDERSSLKIYPYVKPTYLICTNLFRDSIYRNAHPQYIFSIINKAIPKETKLILNADDLISSNLGKENEKVYFSIGKQPTDVEHTPNIINDMQVCPNCNTKLKYNYAKYHHIGNAYCPNCDFKSHDSNYIVKEINHQENRLIVESNGKEENYVAISESMFNIYNEIAVIALLHELGWKTSDIENVMKKNRVVSTRYEKEEICGIKIISHVAKGLNPVACSCVLDYVTKEKSDKEVILLLDDFFEAKESSENIAWIYETDFEFLKAENIKKIVIIGKRSKDYYLRLLLAGIPREKMTLDEKEANAIKYLSLEKGKDIYILYDIYNNKLMENIKETIKKKLLLKD